MSNKPLRRGMTLIEITVTLAIIGLLVVIVAQCIVWSLRERARLATRHAALELAANILETARAQPWERLDQAWADAQRIPSHMEMLLPEGKVRLKVEPGPTPRTRRLTAEVRWEFEAQLPPQSVQLMTLLSERVAKKAGGKS